MRHRRRKKPNKMLIKAVQESTGLSKRTLFELLRKGWTLKKEIDKPDIWERFI